MNNQILETYSCGRTHQREFLRNLKSTIQSVILAAPFISAIKPITSANSLSKIFFHN